MFDGIRNPFRDPDDGVEVPGRRHRVIDTEDLPVDIASVHDVETRRAKPPEQAECPEYGGGQLLTGVMGTGAGRNPDESG